MDQKQYKGALQAMLFAHGEPVSAQRLSEALDIDVSMTESLLKNIQKDCERDDCGLQLLQMEDRWQLGTKGCYGDVVKKVLDTRKNAPLSAAALEVLAVIAYNQPVSRSFIEQVRGVDSSSTVATLMERGLVAEAGRLDLPGRPVSFCTTDVFLRTFGLESLADLPSLHADDISLGMEEQLAEGQGD